MHTEHPKAVRFRKSIMLLVKVLIVLSSTMGFVHTWSVHYPEALFSLNGNFLVIASYILVFVIFGTLYGAFRIGIFRVHEIIYSLCLAMLFTNVIMYVEMSLIARNMVSVWPLLIETVFQVLMMMAAGFCSNTIYFALYKPRRMLAVFTDDTNGLDLIKKMQKISSRFSIERGINAQHSDFESIRRQIDNYEAVLICDIDKNLQKQILEYCYTRRIRTYLLPDITDIIIKSSYAIQISDSPVLMCRNRGLTPEQAFVKRGFDVFFSLLAIVVTFPLMLIIALAIKLDDGGPILFTQNRVTYDNRIFNIYKFRSMIVDADKDGAIKAENNDNRITRVGKVIRACRVDELPQFFNILKGDMSFVGPRPERVENVYEYSCKYPQFDLRHRVKAGLTGYAQLYGKYNTSPLDKLNMDLIYIETYSFAQDIKLIILTIKVLFMKESTEGFDQKANAEVRKAASLKQKEETKNE